MPEGARYSHLMHLPPLFARFAAALLLTAPILRAAPVITEFLADNVTGLTDEDGAHSDWIEVHNPDSAALNLDGWYLTDSAGSPTRWRFPAVTVPPGGFVLVWASGKDRRVTGSPLHTNFSLRAAGEYLALIQSDGTTVQQEFAPEFPSQDPDRTYGVNFNGTPLLTEGAGMTYTVPSSGTDAGAWTQPGFTATGWSTGNTGAGYGILVNGVTVREVRKGVAPLSNLAETDALLALSTGSPGIQSERTVISPVVNFYHDGGEGHYTGNLVFPNGGGDYFAVKATGFIQVTAAQAGAWTFGLNSDDGGRIRIDGTDCMVDNTNHGPADHLGTRTLTAGLHSFEVAFWEQGGGAHLEFFAAPGTLAAWSTTFKLVGDTANGGLPAFTYPAGTVSGGFVRTDMQPLMHGINPGAYFRIPVSVTNPAAFGSLQLGIRYNDGFVAYLNGTEIARSNAPAAQVWNSTAMAARTTEQSLAAEAINVSAHLPLLTTGANVLAIHGLNAGVSDGSFLISPELTASAPLGAAPPVYFNTATPGAINGQASSLGKVVDTAFSVDRGFYTAPISVAITTATPGAEIRYTTNGDTPTATTGTVYTVPLTISSTTTLRAAAFKAGWDQTNVDTHTYIFPDDVVQQSPTGAAPPGWPATAVNGQVFDYGMDPNIVSSANPQTGGLPQVKAALMAIPSFSIVTDQKNLTEPSTGIYVNPGGRGFAWERACSLELLNDPANGGGFQINAGVRIRGGYSRQTGNPKHSFHLVFRQDYGASKLIYPVHGDEGTSELDALDLRTSQNYSWSLHGDGANNTFLREEFTRATQGAMGQPYARGRCVHLYLNGQYWGLFETEERPEAGHGEAYFGGSKDDYDVVKSAGNGGGYTTELTNGTYPAWQSLWDQAMAMRTDPSNARYFQMQGLAADGVTPLNNPAWPRLLDADNQIDYMLIVFWAGSSDAPLTGGADLVNNWFAYRKRDSNMGFLHFAHDMEHSCFGGDRTGPYTNASITNFTYANPQYLHQHMLGNAEYKMRWADRVYRHMFNDGVLTTAKNLARVNAMAATVSSAIIAESARWGDAKIEPPRTKLDWEGARNSFVNFIPGRHAAVLSQLQADGLYPTLAAPGMSQWGGYLSSTQQLFLTAPTGTVYYTVNGADPRITGGTVHGNAQIFTSATTTDTIIPMGSATVPAPWKYLVTNLDQGSEWRGLAFPDATWSTGNSELGYNDGDEVTVIEDNLTPGVPASATDRFITTYFRKTFTVTNPGQYTGFTITLKRDDGAVVYLNGNELTRPNMPPLPAVISWGTVAPASNENTTDTIPVPVSSFINGPNVIAVEVHQNGAGSSDLSFNCSLTATKTNATTPLYLPPGASTVRARTFDGTNWSALAETTFYVDTLAAATGNLVISEIMYHPADPGPAEIAAGFNDAGDFEYVELTNTSNTSYVDLANVRFLLGVGFDFDNALTGRLLAPGAHVLLVKNLAAFQFRYGNGLPVAGEFNGSLDNVGEQLQLVNASGAAIMDFTFADDQPWPAQADGSGRSLVLRRPGADPALPESWRASVSLSGNPGAGDNLSYSAWKSALTVTDDQADEDRDGLTAFAEYAAGGSLAESSQHRWPSAALETLPAGTFQTITATRRAGADDVSFTPESSPDLTAWAGDFLFLRSTMNEDSTESVTWRSAAPFGSLPRLHLRCRLELQTTP
jgi:hypothetical protein